MGRDDRASRGTWAPAGVAIALIAGLAPFAHAGPTAAEAGLALTGVMTWDSGCAQEIVLLLGRDAIAGVDRYVAVATLKGCGNLRTTAPFPLEGGPDAGWNSPAGTTLFEVSIGPYGSGAALSLEWRHAGSPHFALGTLADPLAPLP